MSASSQAQLDVDLAAIRDALLSMPKGARPHLHDLYMEAQPFGPDGCIREEGKLTVDYASSGIRVREHRCYLAIKDHPWFAKSDRKADVELTPAGRKAGQAAARKAKKEAQAS